MLARPDPVGRPLRRAPTRLALALIALPLIACDDGEQRRPAPDADPPGDVTCESLRARLDEQLAGEGTGCAVDSDCVYVAGPQSCDCHTFVGPWTTHRAQAAALGERAAELLAGGCGTASCDALPAEGYDPPACVEGRCVARESYGCLPGSAPDVGPDAAPDAGPEVDPASGAFSSASAPTQPAERYVEQALIYFDTLDVRADPAVVPDYAPDVARWEWPPWLYLTGWGAQQMIATTRAALRFDPSTVEDRDCRFFPTQPFARCYVNFVYAGGDCPIYEEFTFNDAGEMTFLEAWSVQPGQMPVADYAADPWAEGADAERLSTRIPGLGSPTGALELDAPWMQAAAAADADVADFVRRASDFWTTWREAYDAAGGEAVYAIGCGWAAKGEAP